MKELNQAKEALLEEAKELNKRAERLDWNVIEQHMREQGEDEESIALEKQVFESTIRLSRKLAQKE
jgi:hypothetical protein